MAVIAWNTALFPESEREEMLGEAIRDVFKARDASRQADVRSVLTELIARKEAYFAAHRRMTMDYDLTGGSGKWRLTVFSTHEDIPLGGPDAA